MFIFFTEMENTVLHKTFFLSPEQDVLLRMPWADLVQDDFSFFPLTVAK